MANSEDPDQLPSKACCKGKTYPVQQDYRVNKLVSDLDYSDIDTTVES